MNFRRVLTALAAPALFAGLASAQIYTPEPISCSVSSPAQSVRAEGIAERVGDIILTCTGGPAPSVANPANPVDRTKIVIDYGVPVTSKVDGVAGSEVLLTIDNPGTVVEPAGSVLLGFGGNANAVVCPVAANPCPAFANKVTSLSGVTYYVISSTNAVPPVANAANVYQGKVNPDGKHPNQIEFDNVPVLAPVSPNVKRIYRITNVRVTPSGASIDPTITVSPNDASATKLTLDKTQVLVASVSAGLDADKTGVVPVGAVSLCANPALNPAPNQTKANLAILKFTEKFAGAFKTRVAAAADVAGSAQGTVQADLSKNFTTSESGYVQAIGAFSAGLADSGTRLKAIFTGLDKNATYYVSLNPVSDYGTNAAAPAKGAGDKSAVAWATLLNTQGAAGETAAYAADAGFGNANGIVPVQAIAVDDKGNAEVVWEVTNVSGGSAATLSFALYSTWNANALPTIANTAAVQLGFAPTNGDDKSTPKGVTTTWIPRFTAPAMAAAKFFNVQACTTTLLFPFITSAGGYETGIAISNTSADMFGTINRNGGCNLNFFGTGAPASAVAFVNAAAAAGDDATVLKAGTTGVATATSLAGTGFQGYMLAVCDFQYAHGFAYVMSGAPGTPNATAMGYLATVVANTTRGQNQISAGLVGESLGL